MNLRSATYTANALNQYSSRSNPSSVDIIGLAEVGSSVTVNGSGSAYRHGEYFQKDLGVTNNTFTAITVAAGTDLVTGNLYIPPASESYSYDADGNLTADGRWSYLWDAENRLVEMRPQTNAPSAAKMWLKFEYDYLGRRIQKTAAQWTNSAWSLVLSNRFLYDDWNAIAELNATNNTLIRGYLWGVDLSGSLQGAGGVGGLIAVKEGAGDAHFAAYDGNGNVIALVNSTTGNYSAQYEYDPFGQTIGATGPMAKLNPYHFSTKYQDEECGWYYYGYRYYNPSSGRWVKRDPIEEFGGFNLIMISGNDPINDIDSLGLCGCKCKQVSVSPGQFSVGVEAIPNPRQPGPTRILRIGLPIDVKYVVEGDPSLCKCKYADSGRLLMKLGDGPMTGRDFQGDHDTHERPCEGFTDWPGMEIAIGPADITLTYRVIYMMSVTASCTGTDGSHAQDSAKLTGSFSGTAEVTSGGGRIK